MPDLCLTSFGIVAVACRNFEDAASLQSQSEVLSEFRCRHSGTCDFLGNTHHVTWGGRRPNFGCLHKLEIIMTDITAACIVICAT